MCVTKPTREMSVKDVPTDFILRTKTRTTTSALRAISRVKMFALKLDLRVVWPAMKDGTWIQKWDVWMSMNVWSTRISAG